MDDILSLRLEAHNDAADHHRVYLVMIGRDLFARWSLRICYGRKGQRLRELQFSTNDESEMNKLVREHLRRRLSAPRRIGCAYRLCALSMPGSEAAHAWLPSDLISRFLPGRESHPAFAA